MFKSLSMGKVPSATQKTLSIAITALLVTACGGGSNDGATTTPTPVATPSPSVSSPSTPTPTPTPSTPSPSVPSPSVPSPTPAPNPSPTLPSTQITDFPYITLWEEEDFVEEKQRLNATAISNIQMTIAGKTYRISDAGKVAYDARQLGQGFNVHTATEQFDAVIGGQNHTVNSQGTLRIYQQPNSLVLGESWTERVSGAVLNRTDTEAFEVGLEGRPTKTLPTAGVYRYQGVSFDKDSQGLFSYSIDFGARTGQGTVNLDNNTLTLATAPIRVNRLSDDTDFSIVGRVQGNILQDNEYVVSIFGENAEEVAGFIDGDGDSDIGFGGAKQ